MQNPTSTRTKSAFAIKLPRLWAMTALLCRCLARRRERQALRHLDARLLKDIGTATSAARQEAAKPFWRT